MATFNITKRAFARERLTITNGAAVTLTAATYNDANNFIGQNLPSKQASAARIVLDSSSGQIHFTEEGTTPTTGTTGTDVGNIASAADIIYLDSLQAIQKFKAIALGVTNGIAEVTYYR